MRFGARAQTLAIGGALAVFLVLLLALRLRSWLPFLGAALTYLGLLYACRPTDRPTDRPTAHPAAGHARQAERGAALPDGVARDDWQVALDALAGARRELAALAAEAPVAERPMIERMADLVGAIRLHHEANPGHVSRTRSFVRHTLPRMVAAVAGYVDLARRADTRHEPGHDARLAAVSRQLRGFVPVLEKIDRACVEDDLMALEVNVEVLNEQLGRDRT